MQSKHNTHASDKQLAARYEVSRATIWRWTHEKRLPQPIKLSAGCTRWKLSDIEAWEAECEGVK